MRCPAGTPEVRYIWYDFSPAMKTPIKLTKSFPANESASANVPASTIYLSRLKLNSDINSWKIRVRVINERPKIVKVFDSM